MKYEYCYRADHSQQWTPLHLVIWWVVRSVNGAMLSVVSMLLQLRPVRCDQRPALVLSNQRSHAQTGPSQSWEYWDMEMREKMLFCICCVFVWICEDCVQMSGSCLFSPQKSHQISLFFRTFHCPAQEIRRDRGKLWNETILQHKLQVQEYVVIVWWQVLNKSEIRIKQS